MTLIYKMVHGQIWWSNAIAANVRPVCFMRHLLLKCPLQSGPKSDVNMKTFIQSVTEPTCIATVTRSETKLRCRWCNVLWQQRHAVINGLHGDVILQLWSSQRNGARSRQCSSRRAISYCIALSCNIVQDLHPPAITVLLCSVTKV